MRDESPIWTRPARVLRLLPLAALMAACGPPQESGFAKVTHRGGPPEPPAASHPEPPSLPPGTVLGGGPAQKVTLAAMPAGMTQAMIDAGQQSFGTVCAACHGPNGAGTAAAPALNDAEWLNIAGAYPEIVTIINSGVATPKQFGGMMPPKGGGQFTAEQVNELAAYVYALSHQGS